MDCHEVREELGAFAIGALNGDAAREIELHIERCTACRAEAAAYAQAAVAVPLSAPLLRAPRSLRDRVLDAVLGREERRSRWGFGGAAAAALLLLAAGVAWNVRLQLQVNDLRDSSPTAQATSGWSDGKVRQLLALLAAEDVSVSPMVAGAAAEGAWGIYTWDPNARLGHLVADRLPLLPSGHEYEFWYLTDQGPVSGGTFYADEVGFAFVVTRPAQEIERPSGYAVTIEPEDGPVGREGRVVLK